MKIIKRPVPTSEAAAAMPQVTPPQPPAQEPPRTPAVSAPTPAAKSSVAPSPAPAPVAAPARSPERTAAAPAAQAAVHEFLWRPSLCPPPPESSGGPGTFVATGACSFRQQGVMDCTTTKDDFYLEIKRPAARDATLMILVNVERYTGPGTYDKAEVLVGVADAGYNFRWFSDGAHVTVGEGEKFAEIRPVRLEPLPPVEAPDIDVAGTIWCRPRG